MFRRLTNLSNREVLGILIGVGLLSSGASFIVNFINDVETSSAWWVSWLQNFSTEMFGAFLTFVLLELIVGSREKQREKEQALEQEKARLIKQMRSTVNATALTALEEISNRDWLRDGTLRNVNFFSANLEKADLEEADLRECDLNMANLEWANLVVADLQGASLDGAYLNNASLVEANLAGADLTRAELRETDLRRSRLQGANLQDADLIGANLLGAIFDENTTLPDSSRWSQGVSLAQFTDTSHAKFWQGANGYKSDFSGESLQQSNFRNANLEFANFNRADLSSADLRGAKFGNADLEDALLDNANLDSLTVLPDGSVWSAEVNMRRFTDRSSPDFWRSKSDYSPAYDGKS